MRVKTTFFFLLVTALAAALASLLSSQAQPGPGGTATDICSCPVFTSYEPGSSPPPDCVQSFGLTLSNKVQGLCSDPDCGQPRVCSGKVTLFGQSDPSGSACDWVVTHWIWSAPVVDTTGEDFTYEMIDWTGCGSSKWYTWSANGTLLGHFFLTCDLCPAWH